MAAIHDLYDKASIMVGGFGLCGNPENLIEAVYKKNVKDIQLISNNCGTTELGLGILLKNKQVSKIIASYVGENKFFEKQFLSGIIEVELTAQGTLAERIRSGKAGIPGFYTRTGINTLAGGGLPMKYNSKSEVIKQSKIKEKKVFNGRDYLLEKSLGADFSFIKAYKSDTFGNLVFKKTARNFNDVMCGAAKINIVEVEKIVPMGEIKPEEIHVPGLYVQRIFCGTNYNKWIERSPFK
jgi:3-oxoacid CoA-transferase